MDIILKISPLEKTDDESKPAFVLRDDNWFGKKVSVDYLQHLDPLFFFFKMWTLSAKISSVEKSDGCHAQAGFCLVWAKSVRQVASSHDVDYLVRAIKMLELLILTVETLMFTCILYSAFI